MPLVNLGKDTRRCDLCPWGKLKFSILFKIGKAKQSSYRSVEPEIKSEASYISLRKGIMMSPIHFALLHKQS